MTDIDLDREALALFEAFLEAEPDIPDAWLAHRTAGRPELLRRVKAFIAVETEVSLRTGGATSAIEQEGPAPTRLGGYDIAQKIGAGGMGSVYLARRDRGDFEHVAAIKIIRPGLLSQRLVDRFRRERQILARLRHPNIAQLFDGGETEDGSPYIIMEYVEGRPITAWAEETGAGRTERVDRLLQACAAVSFAHANLIVHRDITPSNVMVTADGVVKLIDFGIARPVGATRAQAPAPSAGEVSSLQTLSLTPGFAAPERMTGAEPTTAADIYSLGKLAQRLLDEEKGDRELGAILARATEQAPEHRYASVDLLAADLKAWRDGRTVTAYEGGQGYALSKFVKRHRAAVWSAGAGLALLLVAFTLTGLAFFRAESARAAEARRFEDVRALATYLLFDLNDQLRAAPGNTSARADLAARAQTYLDTLAATPGASRELRLETAQGLLRLAEIQDSPLARNLNLTEAARQNLAKARDILNALQGEGWNVADVAVAEARLEAIASLIAFYDDTDPEASLAHLQKGQAALERVAEPARTEGWRLAQRDLSRAAMERFSANEQFAELVAAADAHDAMVDQWPPEEGDGAAIEHAWANYNRGLAWSLMEREAEGYPAMRAAHDVFTQVEKRSPGHPDLLFMIGWAGADAYAAAARIGKEIEAEDVLTSAQHAVRRLTEIEDRDDSARTLSFVVGEAYAQHLANVGRFEEAIAEQKRLLAARIAELEPTSSGANAAWAELILGQIARQAGNRDLACSSYTAAEARFARADAAGRLVEFHRSFLPGLRARIAACNDETRLEDFPPLR